MSVVRPAAAGAVAPSWPAFRSRNATKIIITPATIAYAPIVSAIAKAPMSGRISSSTPAMTERTPAAMMIHSPSIRLRSRNRGHDLRHAGDQRPRADQHGQREGRDGRPDERDDACADAGDAGHDIQRPVRPVLVAHRVDQQADPVDQRVRAEQDGQREHGDARPEQRECAEEQREEPAEHQHRPGDAQLADYERELGRGSVRNVRLARGHRDPLPEHPDAAWSGCIVWRPLYPVERRLLPLRHAAARRCPRRGRGSPAGGYTGGGRHIETWVGPPGTSGSAASRTANPNRW